jgi:hypothetical protein
MVMSPARCAFLALATFVGLSVQASSTALAQGVQHFAVLNGGNEVSPTGQASAGDLDGSGAASIIVLGSGRICFSILVERIGTPTLAHIHEGEAGTNGPIVVNLTPPAAGNPGTSAGCVGSIGAGLLTRIRNTPNQFYVNVHNGAFPAGAVRGQLF